MDVWRITVAALRRWYILLPLLALTGYATVTVGDSVRPQYEVTATGILVPGIVESEIANPYGGLEDTATVLAIVLDNPASRAHIESLGLNSQYVVDPRSRTTIVDFSVVGETPQMGLATGKAVLDLASEELAQRQGAVGIPADAQVGVQILQAPSVTAVVADGKMRNMAIVAMLGAAVSVLIAILFDDMVGLIRRGIGRRRERRAAPREAAGAGTPEDEVVRAVDQAASASRLLTSAGDGRS
ncbi:hypothetical protein LQF12_12900 [Ruania suaedae]|uniref:hypothetical protein n=1 Tax=Ruania suaedae TaxID=2897774 RepID=UPI001E3F15A4|nr:hypothetical protein [Ruania suaedae]UFU02385.1 hypothetical protein LQF12_12900 [Ruania suaedae]